MSLRFFNTVDPYESSSFVHYTFLQSHKEKAEYEYGLSVGVAVWSQKVPVITKL